MKTRSVIWFALACLSTGVAGCVEGGNLAFSGGAPVTAVVRGRITRCGEPVSSAEVVLQIQQNQPDQTRPIDTRIGPVTTTREGEYLIDVGPPFAVPGPANMQIQVTAGGTAQEISGGRLELRLGRPARDTTRFDADLGTEGGVC